MRNAFASLAIIALVAAVALTVSMVVAPALPLDAGPGLQTMDCPVHRVEPPTNAISDGDSVKLSRSRCYGSCPDYQVRVWGDGRIEWLGKWGVEIKGDAEARMPAAAAKELIRRFQTAEAWSLCERYFRPTTDNPTYRVEVQIAGRIKNVLDYAASAPDWFRELELAIDEVADTHRFLHGDPAGEPILYIDYEDLPKQGLTDLMRAAERGNAEQTFAPCWPRVRR